MVQSSDGATGKGGLFSGFPWLGIAQCQLGRDVWGNNGGQRGKSVLLLSY